jgi:uncharacterized membrane protein
VPEKRMTNWETAPHRAWKDTKNWVIGQYFIAWISSSLVILAITTILSALFNPINTSRFLKVIFGFVGGLIAIVVLILIIYIVQLFVAMKKQRDEVRIRLNIDMSSGNLVPFSQRLILYWGTPNMSPNSF